MTTASSKAGHRKRIREKYGKASLDGFHDYEALELLLTFAIPRRDVKPLAKELIKRFKGLKGVFDAGIDELAATPGVGEHTAVLLLLLKEISGAYLLERMIGGNPVRSAKDVVDFLDRACDPAKEALYAVYLNSKNEILGVETIFDGATEKGDGRALRAATERSARVMASEPEEGFSSSISPRSVIEKAFKHNARSIIFVHNTPEAAARASVKERTLARELESAASSIDIIVHDYLIRGKGGQISARELGWIKGAS
ncbi:MAG: RadC family protein [Deltaproteobacteria bacterium]|nr:RadC family protein [Deltaproteobacteria bacterium]